MDPGELRHMEEDSELLRNPPTGLLPLEYLRATSRLLARRHEEHPFSSQIDYILTEVVIPRLLQEIGRLQSRNDRQADTIHRSMILLDRMRDELRANQ